MTSRDERIFAWLVRLYPREFRERYREDLLAFFRQDREHPKYGSGFLRPARFWTATVRDLARAVAQHRRAARLDRIISAPPPGSWFGHVGQDLRFAWRGLWASPGVAISALAVLTLGIGAGTAVFSVVDAVVLRGLPFPDDRRLVSVAETDLRTAQPTPTVTAPQNYADWRARQDAFESMAATTGAGLFTTRDEPTETLRTYRVTASLFDVLRIRPARGRAFGAGDEHPGAAPVAIISDRLWRRRFGADPSIVGRTIATRTTAYEIVGVMPAGFSYPLASVAFGPVDVWLPFVPSPAMLVHGDARTYMLAVIARLKPGVTLPDAAARMTRIRDAMAVEYPAWFVDRGVAVRPLQDAIVGASVRSWMLLLLGAVTVVVLMACLNAANLLLARAVVRAPELAVRMALGASRWNLARSLLVESLLLSALGTVGGVLVAIWGVEILRTMLPAGVPRLAAVALDLRVLTVAALAAVVSGVAFGTIPALQASRPDVVTLLRQGGRSHSGGRASHRLRTGLVVAEVALAVVLLSGSGLFFASFMRVTAIDLGFDPRNVVAFLGSVVDSRQLVPAVTAEERDTALRGQSLVIDAIARLRAVPGVMAVAPVQDGHPLSGNSLTVKVQHADRQTPPFTGPDEAVVRSVGAGYLDVLRATLVSGRWIADADAAGTAPVVVLSDDAARRYFGSGNPLGQRLLMDDYERTVVGVMRAMRGRGPESDAYPEAFIPFFQTSHPTAQLLVRTDGAPASIVPALQAAIRAAIPGAAIGAPLRLEESYAAMLEQRKFNMIMLSLFGTVAVAIAAIGIYGVMSFLVAQRRREIGVRVALGALPAGILALVLGRAVRLMAAGLVPGLVAALLLERTARAFLFDARPHDPTVYAGVALVLAAAGLIAAIGPARRATRVDPLTALRLE